MKLTTKFLTIITSLILTTASSKATVVMVDFGVGGPPVQSGFVVQNSGSATYSTLEGDVTVATTGAFFLRPASGYQDADLLSDFTFLNGAPLVLTISGPGILANTAYDIKFYSYDPQHGVSGGTVSYTGINGTTGGTSIAYSSTGQNDPGFADVNSSLTSWTSNSSGEIVISVSGTNEGPRVNGLEIYTVPEPSSALLCGFGLLALLRRRR